METLNLVGLLGNKNILAEIHHKTAFVNHIKRKSENAHIHDCCEIYFNISGNVSFAVEKNIYPIKSGDIIITKPNEVHYCIYNANSKHEWYCLWIDATEDFKYLLSPFFEHENGENNLISLDHEDKTKLITNFDTLINGEKENNSNTIKQASAILNILNLLDEYKFKTSNSLKLPKALIEILKYIDSNYNNVCTIETISKQFFISRSSIGRLFKNYLNTTPTKYIENKRLSVAKVLLTKNITVQEVFENCGFADYSHFIALFKKRFGITPLKYKKTHIG